MEEEEEECNVLFSQASTNFYQASLPSNDISHRHAHTQFFEELRNCKLYGRN